MWFRLSFICFWLLAVGHCTVRNTDKQASAYCQYIEGEEGALQVRFNVKLNTDPVGRMTALNNADYNQSPKVYTAVTPCTITYDSTNKVYSVTSKKDRAPADAIDRNNNLCGMTEKSENGVKVYELMFMHQIMTNNFDMIDDKDRVYTVRCTDSNSVSNMVQTSVTVQTPNLPVTVSIASLPVTMSVWLKNTATNTYSVVAAGTAVPAGSTVRLQLELDRGANYVENLNVYGIYTFLTEAGDTSSFTKQDYLVDSNGCRYGQSTNAAPYLPTVGFKGSVQTLASGSKYVLTTGDFTIWKYTTSNNVYFRTYFDVCFAQSTESCTNLCKARTGNEARRKRQSQDGEQLGIAFTSIKVSVNMDEMDEKQTANTADAAKSTTMLILLGSVLGVLLIMLLAAIVGVIAVMRRRREHMRFENMSIASTDVTSISKT